MRDAFHRDAFDCARDFAIHHLQVHPWGGAALATADALVVASGRAE